MSKIEEAFESWLQYIHRDFGGIDRFLTLEQEFTEWLPDAQKVYLIGEFNEWKRRETELEKDQYGKWRVNLPKGTISHGQAYKLEILNANGEWKDRNLAYSRYMRQEPEGQFNCIYFESKYQWKHPKQPAVDGKPLLIYEAHVGIASSEPRIGSYTEFATTILPKIKSMGYNTLQLMAVPEHAYYGSFGYQITNLFSASSRFGSPDDLKHLCDTAHGLGLRVILDFCLSHTSTNADDGIGDMDGSGCQYFYSGARGYHPVWDCKIYDLTKTEVVRYLINALRFYIEEYRVDGFRLDAITSMMFKHHGICKDFNSEADYFNEELDIESCAFLKLAIHCIRSLHPDTVFIAEDASGFPNLGVPQSKGGFGFDYVHAMNCPDIVGHVVDQFAKSGKFDLADQLVQALVRRKRSEKYVAYVECHDQCIHGGQTLIHRLLQERSNQTILRSLHADVQRAGR